MASLRKWAVESGGVFWLVATIAIGAMFIIPATIKIRWIAYVDWFAVPGFFAIFVLVLYSTLGEAGGFSALWNKPKEPEMSLFLGFDMAAGGWLVGVTIIADLARFWKNAKHAVVGILSAYVGLVTIQYWGGAIGAAHTGVWNVFLIANALGLGILAWLALWFGAQSTVQGGTYAAGLAFSAPPIPMTRNQEFTRRIATAGVGVLGFVGSYYGLDRFANWWVQFLSWVVGPIAITVILDYWALSGRRDRYERAAGADMTVKPRRLCRLAGRFSRRLLRRQQPAVQRTAHVDAGCRPDLLPVDGIRQCPGHHTRGATVRFEEADPMTTAGWLTIAVEILVAVWVVRLIWRAENERPTEQIAPATDADVELVE